MIELQKKYGCLTVLDLGEEYSKSEKYMSLLAEEELLKNEIKKIKEKRDLLKNENPIAFESYKQNGIIDPEFHLRFSQLNYDLSTMVQRLKAVASKIELHYKCRCRCGKTHYYNEKTLESKPKYCIYPIPISTSYTYSIRAQNATSRKREKYENIECVVLADKSKCMPSDEFCDIYNEYKTKQLENKEIVREKEKSRIPRVKANNYDIDYVGKHYETLFVEECTDENLEDEPSYSLKQRHNKHRHTIIVHRQYRCRCTLCGKEQYVNCDDFGIYPPTEYGIHAYNGYWSKVSCECHKISSFQWMVNKLLFENNVTYLPEYSFPDLYGYSGSKLLRFDFAILNSDSTVKCVIECQGEQHYMPVEEFGGKSQFEIQVKNDELKKEYTQRNNIPMIQISYREKQYELIEKILRQNEVI